MKLARIKRVNAVATRGEVAARTLQSQARPGGLCDRQQMLYTPD
jgi:hypothetical protein